MNKTIAARFFTATSLLIIASISVLGITFMIFANKYFEGERINILNLCVSSAVETLETTYGTSVDDVAQSKVPLREQLRLISATTQTTVFVANKEGRALVCTDSADTCAHLQKILPHIALEKTEAQAGIVSVSDIFAAEYQENSYTAGTVLRDKKGEVTGYIFASSDASSIMIFTNALLSIFLLSAGVMILLSSIVSLAITSKLTTPLTSISDAAKRFSQGDFSARAMVGGDDEVAHLAYTFNNMATFAEKNETSRSNFVTNIAHELRTPMTSIKGFVDGIIDGTIEPKQQNKYLKIVSDEIGRLARLTNSMLNISKLDSGEFIMNVEKYNIWDTITAVAFAFENRIEAANISIKGFEPQRIRVVADKDIIHQVVYNIVDNALKFTPDNGYITFHVAEDKASGFVVVKIRNSGVGIRKEALPYVFERFYKADASRSVHTKGAGIGLYIAKTLVQRSGGDIDVESQEGEYTEFIFTLPMATNEKPEKTKKSAPNGEKSKK